MKVLRRFSTLVPLQVDTATAPSVAAGTDVPGGRVAGSPSAVRDDGDGCGPLTVIPASRHLPPKPPLDLPGICYHHAHIDHDGERYGVLVLNDRDASLLRCSHVNKDGR